MHQLKIKSFFFMLTLTTLHKSCHFRLCYVALCLILLQKFHFQYLMSLSQLDCGCGLFCIESIPYEITLLVRFLNYLCYYLLSNCWGSRETVSRSSDLARILLRMAISPRCQCLATFSLRVCHLFVHIWPTM